jgi:NADH:ubiquinone oxidoreductase subunit 6 (subunit J)
MWASVLQLLGLVLFVVAGGLVSWPALLVAVVVVAVYVGLALERD